MCQEVCDCCEMDVCKCKNKNNKYTKLIEKYLEDCNIEKAIYEIKEISLLTYRKVFEIIIRRGYVFYGHNLQELNKSASYIAFSGIDKEVTKMRIEFDV